MFDDFVQYSVVGPELPSLFRSGETLAMDDENMIARIQRSKELRMWHNFGRHPERAPDYQIEAYDNTTDDPSTGQLLRVLKFYLEDAKAGDLVIVPPQNFKGKVHIGEFVDGPENAFLTSVSRYPGDPIVARRVKWIGVLDKVDMPANLIEAFRKPTPLLLVGEKDRPIFYNSA